MDGWKDGWMDGWMGGWMDGWSGFMGGCMDRWMGGRMDGGLHGRTGRNSGRLVSIALSPAGAGSTQMLFWILSGIA